MQIQESVPRDADTLTLTRTFDAPRALVFRAWTEPEHLRRWCAPHGFTIPASDGDLRPGGVWRATMRAPDGTEHRLVGRYVEIAPPERLAFTHAWLDENGRPGQETVVTVTLEDRNGGTFLTLTQTGFASAASRDGHRGGWSETLDRLGEHLAATIAGGLG
jgi:uncharacterized protein YndB with AHSA1/START domain